MNPTALPQLASCPALPPPPVPDVDCAGAWDSCTAACELADSRGWVWPAVPHPLGPEDGRPTGLGRACPARSDCRVGQGDCVEVVAEETAAELPLEILIAAGGGGCCCATAVLWCIRRRSRKVRAMGKYDSSDDLDHSEDSDEEEARRKRDLAAIKKGTKTAAEVLEANERRKAARLARKRGNVKRKVRAAADFADAPIIWQNIWAPAV